MKRWLILLVLTSLVIVGIVSAESAVLDVTLDLVTTVNTQPNIDSTITDITHAGDNRLFIVEQGGRISIFENGALLPTPFLDISAEVASCNECGLLGLEFHPDYATNGQFFVNYVDSAIETVVERFNVSPTEPNLATKTGRQVILSVDQPAGNHNGGQIRFGPDGYLYIAMGDGGDSGDPDSNGQTLTSLLGNLLRLDVTGVTTYTIPADNPFVDDPAARDEIWASGLRNPYRFSFDSDTGALWMGDVGQGGFEEINYQPASSTGGENYGWDCYEAYAQFSGAAPSCSSTLSTTLTFPVHAYPRPSQGCASITGGQLYRGNDYPSLQGHYFFSDYCIGEIWTLSGNPTAPISNTTTATVTKFGPTTFGNDNRNELYVGYNSGAVYKITSGTLLTVGLSNLQITDMLPILTIVVALFSLFSWRLLRKSEQ